MQRLILLPVVLAAQVVVYLAAMWLFVVMAERVGPLARWKASARDLREIGVGTWLGVALAITLVGDLPFTLAMLYLVLP
jgi:hypothetical protein